MFRPQRNEGKTGLYRKALYMVNPHGKWVIHRRYDVPWEEAFILSAYMETFGYRVEYVGKNSTMPEFVKLRVKALPRDEWLHFWHVRQVRNKAPFLWKAMYEVLEDAAMSGKPSFLLNISRVADNFGTPIHLFDIIDYVMPFIRAVGIRGKSFRVTSHGNLLTNDRFVRVHVQDNPKINNSPRWD